MSFTAIATYHGFTETIDLTEDCHTYDDALDTFIYILEGEHDILGSVEEADIEIKLEDVPHFINDWAEFDEFAPHYFKSHYSDDISIWEAADACGIPFADVDEAYNGEHGTDEEFAEYLLEEHGYTNNIPSWIQIDWETTARNIMYDYEEDSGHYFRRF